jgi:tetratricopeptide (TPR) repeat protein
MPIDASKKVSYDFFIDERKALLAKKDVKGAVLQSRLAAEAFAGSTDPQELDLRHRAFADGANLLRTSGQLEAAEKMFDEIGVLAQKELGAHAFPFLFARYSLGLVRDARADYDGAVAPFRDALAGFDAAGQARETALVAAALGLALLHGQHWADAATTLADALKRLGNSEPTSRASTLHNLTLALVHAGRAAEAVETGAQAVALRRSLTGENHPLWVDTALVHAMALVDAGQSEAAAAQIRHAAQIILAGAGEAHSFFADALLVEARRVARAGDGPAAEALGRRAMFILESQQLSPDALRQRRADAAALGPIWRTGQAAQSADDVVLWELSLQHTLRRYQVAQLSFAGSGDRPRRWFAFVPASWSTELARYAAQLIFADENRFLNAREPADANFLDTTAATARRIATSVLESVPLKDLFADAVWERSVFFNLASGKQSIPLNSDEISAALKIA